MQNKKLLLWAAAILSAAALAGCSKNDKENNYTNFHKVPITDEGNDNSMSKDLSNDNRNNDNSNNGSTSENLYNGNDADSLIFYSDVQGHVVEFSSTGCTISPAKTEEADGGGQIMFEAASGYENEEDNVNIYYSDNCQFQLAKIDIATGKADISDVDISNIKKQTSLIIYGKWKDNHNIEATKVIITRYE